MINQTSTELQVDNQKGVVSDFTAPLNQTIETSSECGPISPSYYYFNDIAPTVDYPFKFASDTSEVFTLKNIDQQFLLRDGGDLPMAPRSAIFVKKLDEFFSDEDFLCWSRKGDQVAHFRLGSSDAVVGFYKNLRSFESDLSVSGEHPLLLPTFETNTSSGLNVSFRHLKEAAKPRVVFCPIGKGGDWSDLPQCQPATLTTVFEHGLPQAHSMLKDLYKHGPMEIRDFRLAEYHEAVSGLQGRFGNFLKLYTCEILNKIKMDASMVDLFFKRLESDAFYPHGITNQSDVPLIRENILMELNSCL